MPKVTYINVIRASAGNKGMPIGSDGWAVMGVPPTGGIVRYITGVPLATENGARWMKELAERAGWTGVMVQQRLLRAA